MKDLKPLPPDVWLGPPAARLRDLPEPERTEFHEWLRGQTVPALSGVPAGEQDAFYIHDYRRWKSCRGRQQQGWF